jgi:hypothetical protein
MTSYIYHDVLQGTWCYDLYEVYHHSPDQTEEPDLVCYALDRARQKLDGGTLRLDDDGKPHWQVVPVCAPLVCER